MERCSNPDAFEGGSVRHSAVSMMEADERAKPGSLRSARFGRDDRAYSLWTGRQDVKVEGKRS